MRKNHQLPILIEKDEDGFYVVECPIFSGCYSQGKTIDEEAEEAEAEKQRDVYQPIAEHAPSLFGNLSLNKPSYIKRLLSMAGLSNMPNTLSL